MAELDLADNEELSVKVQKLAQDYYDKFASQRTEYEDIWKTADYMVKAAQNRTIATSEKTKGVNASWSTEPRAQTGSTLFFQQWRHLSSQIASVALSRPVPFKFEPVTNEAVFHSSEDADEMAHQHNTLARWTLKQDRFASKFISFCHALKKYGNVPVLFFQNQKIEKRTVMEPQSTFVPQPNGEVLEIEGEAKPVEVDVVVENWPSWRALPPDAVYADVYIGTLQDQDCVVLPSLKSRAGMLAEVKGGNWNQKQFEKVTATYKWDGSTNVSFRQDRMANEGLSAPPADGTEMYMVWDIFIRCPIDGKKWDDEAETIDIYWITVVGNTIGTGIVVRFQENEDPDGEIPVWMFHSLPGDDDILYHMSEAQVVRSNYSVECTIKNQMIDNNSNVNNPPLKEIEGQVRGTDRAYGPNKVFRMDSPDSLQEFDVKPLSQENILLLNWIRDDTRSALSTTGNVLGESFGGRTSALEASNAYRNSIQPHMITVRYILENFLGVLARKMLSYWDKFAMPGQILAISDETQLRTVYPAGLHGQFDIEINVIDDYEEDVVQSQKIYDVINLVGANPEIAKHIDIGELMTTWLSKSKINNPKIVKRPFDYDAKEVARRENRAMMQGAVPATVKQGENLTIHLAEHEGERLRYRGLEEEYPNVQLLDQHIEETKLAVRNGPTSQGTPPAQSGNQGPGEMGGNQIAAAMGGALGG